MKQLHHTTDGFAEQVADYVDEMISDMLEKVKAGHVMTQDEATFTLLQLQQDRAKMRALTHRQGSTMQ